MPDPTLSNFEGKYVHYLQNIDSFITQVSGLGFSTTYYFRAYMIITGGVIFYGYVEGIQTLDY
jgi:hypothetical protein